MSRFLLGALTAALLFVADPVLRSSAFAAESAELPPQNTITMNFQNVDIPVLAKFISEITGRNFIIDESVRGKVTIISPSKVTPEQAYSIFQSVLQVKGFTTVQAGKIIKIVPARNVRSIRQADRIADSRRDRRRRVRHPDGAAQEYRRRFRHRRDPADGLARRPGGGVSQRQHRHRHRRRLQRRAPAPDNRQPRRARRAAVNRRDSAQAGLRRANSRPRSIS